MYMLDTDTCIFAIKKKTEALLAALRSHMNDGLSISSITLAELEFGIANSRYPEKNRVALMEFLDILTVRPFDDHAAREYGEVKRELKDKKSLIGPLDMLIGAHARSLGLILVTNNTREFSRISSLDVENWYR